MLKVAYDYQIFCSQKYGGIARYIYELATEIANFDNHNVQIIAGLYVNKYLEKCTSSLVKGWQINRIEKTSKILSLINTELSKKLLTKPYPNVIHETYYSRRTIAPKKSKIVVTVHDMIHEKFSHIMPKIDVNFPITKAKAIKRADHIICVSENTKKDLIEILNLDPIKISTIYHGFSLQQNINIEEIPNITCPYILYVGERKSYKNFNRLLQAYGNHKMLKNNFKLVCFGSLPFSRQELSMISNFGLDDKNIIHTSGDDRVLANLYTYASAFVYPSLYEGFGLPLLEAMSFGCPVICSNTSSIPEVVSEAGEYFNPYEIDSIANAIEKVIFSTEESKKLKILSKERVKYFSWEKCAKETSTIYKSLT